MSEAARGHVRPRRNRRKGVFIVVVGPDGVGKTTAARQLVRLADGPTAYFHFRPAVLSPLAAAPPDSMDSPLSKGPTSGSVVLGWVRLTRNLVWFWVAYLVRLRPALRRGTTVIGDRWAFGYLAQPGALKFFGPHSLARLTLALFPRPDLVANLTASAETIRRRKAELSTGQIEEELEAWSRVPGARAVDATNGPEETARAIMKELE